jgi:hypothetical protein
MRTYMQSTQSAGEPNLAGHLSKWCYLINQPMSVFRTQKNRLRSASEAVSIVLFIMGIWLRGQDLNL